MDKHRHIIPIKEVVKITFLSKGTIYNREKLDPTFPRKVSLGGRRVGYFYDEVIQWLESNRVQ